MEQLPHNPGSLSSQFVNRNAQKTLETLNNPDSVANLQVAGRNHQTGDLLLSYPGSNAAVPATPTTEADAYPGQRVQATRHTPQSGQRKVQATTGKPDSVFVSVNGAGTVTKGATKPNEPKESPDACDEDDNQDPDGPQEDPPGDPDQPTDPEGPNGGNPGDGGSGGGSGAGCDDANDPCGWYTGSCPEGTTESSSQVAPDGSTKKLCCGAGRPPGEGCDWKNPPVKFKCVNGSCIQDVNGSFSSYDECIESGCQEDNDKPEPPGDPNDPGNTGPDGENGSPSDGGGGGSGTIDGPTGDPPFTGGQCCDVSYKVAFVYEMLNRGVNNSCTTSKGSKEGTANVTGKVLGIAGENVDEFAAAKVYLLVQDCAGVTSEVNVVNSSQSCFGSASITSVTPLNGAVDNCGDPPSDSPEL